VKMAEYGTDSQRAHRGLRFRRSTARVDSLDANIWMASATLAPGAPLVRQRIDAPPHVEPVDSKKAAQLLARVGASESSVREHDVPPRTTADLLGERSD